MAVVKFGPVVTKVRGSIGQISFTGTSTTQTALTRTFPQDIKSTKQQAIRTTFKSITALWNALSASDKWLWKTYAESCPEIFQNRMGETITLTGWQMYNTIASRQYAVGKTPPFIIPTEYPVSYTPSDFHSIGIHYNQPWHGYFKITPVLVGDADVFILQVQTTKNWQNKPPEKDWKNLGYSDVLEAGHQFEVEDFTWTNPCHLQLGDWFYIRIMAQNQFGLRYPQSAQWASCQILNPI